MAFWSNLPKGLVKIGCRSYAKEHVALAKLLKEICDDGDVRAIKIVALMNNGHHSISRIGIEEMAARLHNLDEEDFVQEFLSWTRIAEIEREEKKSTLDECMAQTLTEQIPEKEKDLATRMVDGL